jgi:hypothetical protein
MSCAREAAMRAPERRQNVIEGTAEPVALPAPEAPYSRAQAPAGLTLTRRVAGGLIAMATLPQGDGLAWPAFAGGLIGRELAFSLSASMHCRK